MRPAIRRIRGSSFRLYEITFATQGGGEFPTTLNGQDLTAIPYYASGPCQGQAAGQCRFDGRALLEINGRMIEVITAYGRVWRFDGVTPLASSGQAVNAQSPWNKGLCR